MAASAKPVNYDQIAPSYDQRYVVNRLDGVEAALLALATQIKAKRVLEAGCGTGRWIANLSSIISQLHGLDLSPGMLQQARLQWPDFHLTCGRAGRLPFCNRSFDLVFCVNALHHFDHPQNFISEAASLLKPGGCLAIIGQIPQDPRNCWYVYDYFEGTCQADLNRFNTWDTVRQWMADAGFTTFHLSQVEHIQDHKYGKAVLKDPFLKKDSVSQLALLSAQDYQRGIQRIEAALAAAEVAGKTLVFQVELRLELLTGTLL